VTRVRYRETPDGSAIRMPQKMRKAIACCDCGLVHWMRVRVSPTGRVYLIAMRDDRETARVRRMKGRTFPMRKRR
jgi:hypothetical protein